MRPYACYQIYHFHISSADLILFLKFLFYFYVRKRNVDKVGGGVFK